MGKLEQVRDEREADLLAIEGVEGVGIGDDAGTPCIVVYASDTRQPIRERIAAALSGVRYRIEASGEFHAQ